MATLTETMSVFRMPSRYIYNAFFSGTPFLVQDKNDFCENSEWRSPELKCFVWKLRMISPFSGVLRMLFLKFENASHTLRMLFEELKMLLPLWECLSWNWKCFSRFENAFREIENASHALRMLFEKLKMLLTFWECFFEKLRMLPTFWECFSKSWKCFSHFENAFREIENASRTLRIIFEELKMLLSSSLKFEDNNFFVL